MGAQNTIAPIHVTESVNHPRYAAFDKTAITSLQTELLISQEKTDLNKDEKKDIVEYDTQMRERAEGKEFRSAGMLRLGRKQVLGVNMIYAAFQPDVEGGEFCDISSSVRLGQSASRSETKTRYVKVRDAKRTNWSFDIEVEMKSDVSIGFKGTAIIGSITYDWESTEGHILQDSPTILATRSGLQRPLDANASLQELVDINPYALADEGRIKQGQDKAQYHADELFKRIILCALDQDTRRLFRINDNLTDTEWKILKDNREFCERAAVHIIADQFKDNEVLTGALKRDIQPKSTIFFQMLTYPEPKPGHNDPHDPVVAYGWKRSENGDELKKLQGQYNDMTQRCYMQGFQYCCPKFFSGYVTHAEYWFKSYASYLVSDEHVATWTAQLPEDHDLKAHDAIQKQVLLWGNKLLLLKQHAPESTQRLLKVDDVTTFLNSACQLSLAKGQILALDTAKQLEKVLDVVPMDKPTDTFRSTFTPYADGLLDRAKELKNEMAQKTLELTNGEHPIREFVEHWWSKRLPGEGHAPKELTYAQVIEALEDSDEGRKVARFTEAPDVKRLATMSEQEIEKECGALWAMGHVFENKTSMAKKSFKQWWNECGGADKAVDKIRGGWNKVKSILHGGCAILLAAALIFDDNKVKDAVSIVLTLTSETLGLLKSVATRFFSAVFGRFQVCGNIVAWLKDATLSEGAGIFKRVGFQLFGNLSKFCKTLGLIGAILGVVSSYEKLQESHDEHDEAANREVVLARAQFALGLIEIAVSVAGMGCEVFGCTTGALVFGAIGLVAAVVGMLVMVIYMLACPPDDLEPYKKFLNDWGRKYGSYAPSEGHGGHGGQ